MLPNPFVSFNFLGCLCSLVLFLFVHCWFSISKQALFAFGLYLYVLFVKNMNF